MAAPDHAEIAFVAFGATVTFSVPARLRSRALALAPPNAVLGPLGGLPVAIRLDEHDGVLRLRTPARVAGATIDDEVALAMLESELRGHVAIHAPDHVFVTGSAVIADGRAVLLPGRSFTGRTTLVRALVAGGAEPCSDDFIVLDAAGRAVPDPELGPAPVPVGLVAITPYRPGAHLELAPLARGAALLELLSHAVAARLRPEPALRTLKAATAEAEAFTGERDEAGEAAAAILAALRTVARVPA